MDGDILPQKFLFRYAIATSDDFSGSIRAGKSVFAALPTIQQVTPSMTPPNGRHEFDHVDDPSLARLGYVKAAQFRISPETQI
jgi:hypothetical protein